MDAHYFAGDGNFGSSEGLAVLDTSQWTEDDWMEIENVSDDMRADLARQIAQNYVGGVTWE